MPMSNPRFDAALDLVRRELDRRRGAGYTRPVATAAALARLQVAQPSRASGPRAPAVSKPAPVDPVLTMPAKPDDDDGSLSLFGAGELVPGVASAKPAKAPPVVTPPVGEFVPISDAGASKAERLEQMKTVVLPCVKCPHLAASRRQVVFGLGNSDAEVMFIGEAPGADEDASGEPFVGRAGQLLTKIIQTMGYRREDVYIANVLKCRPDTPGQQFGNRPPTTHEMETCRPYLFEQIAIVQPKAIVALGATAVRGLLDKQAPMKELRGHWHDYQGVPVMATYHPSYLLRNQLPSEKRKVWEDLLLVKERLGHPITERDRGYFLTR